MNFLLKSKNKKDFDYKKIFGVIIFILLIVLGITFPNFSSNLSKNILKPFFFFKDKTSNTAYYITDFFKFKNSLINEKNRLEDEVNKLKLTKIDYELLLKENNDLKSELGRQVETNKVIASVVSKPPQSAYDTFVVDVGLNEDIRVGNMVYISENMAIGKVVEVNTSSSLVKLFSSSGEETEVTNFRTGTNYVVVGNGGANFIITLPKEADVLWGDNFMYPSINSSLIATVNYVDSNSQSSFKDIYLRLPVNIFNTKYVYIKK